MKTILTSVLCISLIGCGATSNQITVPNPTKPSPNAALLVATASVVASCEIGSTLVSPTAAAWLSGPCPTAAEGIIAVVGANGTAAQIQAVIMTLQATYAAIPAGTLTSNDTKYIAATIAAAQLTLSIYEAETGQTVAYHHSLITQAAFQARPSHHNLSLTPAERKQLETLRKRAEGLKKKAK